MKACDQGITEPVKLIKIFKADEVQDAFRYMQKGTYIGRIGISLRDPSDEAGQNFTVAKKPRHLKMQRSGSYILMSDLGGLGRAIAVWMTDAGAQEIIFMARSARTDPEHHIFAEELLSMGCTAKFVKGDVTKAEDVDKALKTCSRREYHGSSRVASTGSWGGDDSRIFFLSSFFRRLRWHHGSPSSLSKEGDICYR